jgi:hypothetical protein
MWILVLATRRNLKRFKPLLRAEFPSVLGEVLGRRFTGVQVVILTMYITCISGVWSEKPKAMFSSRLWRSGCTCPPISAEGYTSSGPDCYDAKEALGVSMSIFKNIG